MHRVFLDIGSQRTPSYAECAGEWDVRVIDVIFVEEKDDEINQLGVKGVGEIGIVGTAAAIAKTRSTMPPASACAICRSRSTS